MTKGKVKKLIRDRGFGFIAAVDGREIFFHRSGVLNDRFDMVQEGAEVEFETEKTPKGPRAVNVKVLESSSG
jgi:CspA family cold shock protein